MALATSRHQHTGSRDSEWNHVHQRLISTGGAGLQASSSPERMNETGPKELPDVGPSGVPYELANSRADESIEQS